MTRYNPNARPFWEQDTPGPITEWQQSRDRAVLLDELRDLKDRAEYLYLAVMDARASSPAHEKVCEQKLAEVDERIDEVRRLLGKPRRIPGRSQVTIKRANHRSAIDRAGAYDDGGDGNGNRRVCACAARS